MRAVTLQRSAQVRALCATGRTQHRARPPRRATTPRRASDVVPELAVVVAGSRVPGNPVGLSFAIAASADANTYLTAPPLEAQVIQVDVVRDAAGHGAGLEWAGLTRAS